jgi:hypothetical protein
MIGASNAHQRFADAPDRRLRAAPPPRLGRRNVEAVLEHIEIKRAQVDDAKVIQAVIDLVERELVVRVLRPQQRHKVCRSMYWSSSSI